MIDRRAFLGGAAALGPAAALGALVPPPRALEVGVCRGIDAADLAKEAGCDYLEVACGRLLVPTKGEQAFAERLAAARRAAVPPRAANSFLPGSLQATGPAADHAAILAYATVAFERARRVGIEVVTFGSSGARSLPAGFPEAEADLQFVALLARLGDLAARHEVVVSVEPLRATETNYVNTVAHGARLVAAAQHPHVGLTPDVYHMLQAAEGPDAIVAAGPLVRHAHVAEAARRTPPGVDGDDFRPYLRALGAIGYAGRVSIEARWDDLATQLAPAVAELRRQLAG